MALEANQFLGDILPPAEICRLELQALFLHGSVAKHSIHPALYSCYIVTFGSLRMLLHRPDHSCNQGKPLFLICCDIFPLGKAHRGYVLDGNIYHLGYLWPELFIRAAALLYLDYPVQPDSMKKIDLT
ncbi:MAG: hypothetical protein BWY40_01378 [bacterium ADurb.Bin270]|nr:MAG: hypothetical protein BWY40_01378 [bacterium ADurb.Bin270]